MGYLLTSVALQKVVDLIIHPTNSESRPSSAGIIDHTNSCSRVSSGGIIDPTQSKGKVFYGQEPPSGESTATEYGFNYQLLAVMY